VLDSCDFADNKIISADKINEKESSFFMFEVE
jgi:hypothetical protein